MPLAARLFRNWAIHKAMTISSSSRAYFRSIPLVPVTARLPSVGAFPPSHVGIGFQPLESSLW
jgi:hypothetical protein